MKAVIIVTLNLIMVMVAGLYIGINLAIEEPYIPPAININHKPAVIATLVEEGIASWYNYDLNSNDQVCKDDDCWSLSHATCASRTHKRYTTITVKNLDNGKTVDCYVNDFGPEESTGRIIDLSAFAFAQIGYIKQGVLNVEVYDTER